VPASTPGPRRSAAAIVDHPEAWDGTVADAHGSGGGTRDAATPLSVLLAHQLAGASDDPAARLRCLESALREIDRHVESVVSSQHRGRYAEVARHVACGAEAVTLEEDADAGVAHRPDEGPLSTARRLPV